MSLLNAISIMRVPRFPRVSGDEPDYALGAESDTEFSPREWG